MDRRTFLQAAIGTAGLAGSSIREAVSQTTAPIGASLPAASFVVLEDPRLPASRLFADTFLVSGATVLRYKGDIASIWYESIPALGASKRTLAGLTLGAEFFLLRTLASDAGLKLLYNGYHERIAEDTMQHRMNGEIEPSRLEHALVSIRQRWPIAVANGLIASELATGNNTDFQINRNSTGRENAIKSGISWMIELASSGEQA